MEEQAFDFLEMTVTVTNKHALTSAFDLLVGEKTVRHVRLCSNGLSNA